MMFLRDILHVYTGGHFVVVVVLVNYKKYTFSSTVNFETVSKMFENINQTLLKNIPMKMLIEPYNDEKVNHFPLPH